MLLFTFHYILSTLNKYGYLKKRGGTLHSIFIYTIKWIKPQKEYLMVNLLIWTIPIVVLECLFSLLPQHSFLFLNAFQKLSINGFKGRAIFKNVPLFCSKHRFFFYLKTHFYILLYLSGNKRHGGHDGQLSKPFQVKLPKLSLRGYI